MKPMKLLSLGLAAAMTLSLCGCGDVGMQLLSHKKIIEHTEWEKHKLPLGVLDCCYSR